MAVNDTIQIALIGAGGMGQGDTRSSTSLEGVKLVAACDLYTGRLERVKEVWIDGAILVVTAHSLPLAALGDDTGYGDDLAETARLVARAAGVTKYGEAWQSAGMSGGRWLDPSLLDVMREEAAAGTKAFVVCAAGFTSEHLEIKYDLDIEAAALAKELGVAFARTRSLDGDPRFCSLLADLIRRQ